jgi:predicted Zn-dependent peptidase
MSASLAPSAGYPGWGTFAAGAPCEPAKAAELAAAIREIFDEFAKTGPTDDEVRIAKGQVHTTLTEAMKDPGYWIQGVNSSTYRGRNLDDVAAGPQAYADLTAADVRAAFIKYDQPNMRFSIRVVPVGADGKPAAGKDHPQE